MKPIFTTILMLAILPMYAQEEARSLSINKTQASVKIDGVLDESVWQTAELATDFWQQKPRDDNQAAFQTVVQMAFDDQFLYLAADVKSDQPPVVRSLKRDNNPENSDSFGVMLDPLGQQTNAAVFIVNAAGAQMEALRTTDDFDLNWDQKWFSATQQRSDGWTLELAIPWRSLRYDADKRTWKLNFIRRDLVRNEFHVWNPVPLQFDPDDLGYTGDLVFSEAIPVVKGNVNLIPYLSSNYQENAEGDGDVEGNIGLDAKIAVSPSLNLDVTVNPDFSQADVDRQVTNLTRFNVFFPERRTFFLENADLFSDFGNFNLSPFFSRRIGLGNFGLPVPILYGLRLSGSLDAKSRIGLMNVQTEGGNGLLAQNYTALSLNRRILKRSVVKGYFLNRQARNSTGWEPNGYARNAGAEMDFITQDGKWSINGGLHKSMQPGIKTKDLGLTGTIFYSTRKFRSFVTGASVGSNFHAEQGFVPNLENYDQSRDTVIRLGFTRIYNSNDYYIIPEKSGTINQHWLGIENIFLFNEGFGLVDYYNRTRYFMLFRNTSALKFRLNNNYIDLPFPFSFTGGELLETKKYHNTEFNIEYNTDVRKELSAEVFVLYGTFYGGTRANYFAEVTWRNQPWISIGANIRQDFIRLPEPYGEADITLVGAELEVNFRQNLFWTTFFQYATQSNNMNINSRLQWRFAPMSDFFLVYTDNYEVEPIFGRRNRSLVAKATYWLGL